ncbi:MAG TPA: glycosyltransferase family 39 protein [Myxococcales bacterium]|nr:glycosyltransferase family 39 protein [Myxococcales bacterium]
MLEDSRLSSRWVGAGLFAWGTACAALFAFVLYRSQGLIESTVDLNGFGILSRSLAEGRGFSFGHGPTLRRAPLFPFLAAGLLKLFGGGGGSDSAIYRPVIAFQCVLLGLTCVVVWTIARRLFGGRAALLAGILCPLSPQSMRYVGMTEVEPLMGLLVALLAYTGMSLVERPGAATGIRFGLTAAAATLTKPIVLLYPPVFGAAALWHWRTRIWGHEGGIRSWGHEGALRATIMSPYGPTIMSPYGRKAQAVAALAVAVAFVLPLVPWSLRNHHVSGGQFVGISSNGPGEFLRGYVNAQPKYYLLRQDFGGHSSTAEKWDPEANAYEDHILRQHGSSFRHFNLAGGGRVVEDSLDGMDSAQAEAEKDRIEGAEMKRRVLREPISFLRKFGIQVVTFWYVVETRTRSLLVGAMALVVLGFALAGVLRARREGKAVMPVVLVILYYNAMYAAFLAFARYSMPLYPTLIALAAGGVTSIARREHVR